MAKGIKTTEFWLSLAAVLLGALTTAGAFDTPDMPGWITKVVGMATAVLASLGYTAARGAVKSADVKSKTS